MLPIKLKCQSGNGRHTKDSGKCRSYCSKENCQKQRYASKGIKNASDSLGICRATCICRATWVQILSKVHLLHVIPLLSHSVSIYCQKTYRNMPKISLKKHSCNITGMFKETVKRATVLNCCLKS